MKKLILLGIIVFLGITLSACQSSENGSDAGKASTSSTPTKEAPVSYDGTWKTEGAEAIVAGDSIEVYILGDDTKSLFWKGTFPAPVNKVVTSVGDRDALDMSMMGSSETEKPFKVSKDKIEFDFSMMGTTKHVTVKR
jgi:hypothetical protein